MAGFYARPARGRMAPYAGSKTTTIAVCADVGKASVRARAATSFAGARWAAGSAARSSAMALLNM